MSWLVLPCTAVYSSVVLGVQCREALAGCDGGGRQAPTIPVPCCCFCDALAPWPSTDRPHRFPPPSAPLHLGAAELLATLRMCYDSLLSTGDVHIANSKMLDVLRQVSTCAAPCHVSGFFYRLAAICASQSSPHRLLCALLDVAASCFRWRREAASLRPTRRSLFPSLPCRPTPLACTCASWTSGRRV